MTSKRISDQSVKLMKMMMTGACVLLALSLIDATFQRAPIEVLKLDDASAPISFTQAAADASLSQQAASMPARQGEAATEYLKQQGVYQPLSEAMRAARYGVYAESEGGQAYYANNAAQEYRARFTRQEARLTGRDRQQREWRFGMKLRGYGYGNRLLTIASGEMKAQGDRAEVRKSAIRNPQSAITEWYVNRPGGIEQGFTIASAPGSNPTGAPLRVALEMSGDLRAEADADGQAMTLRRGDGQAMLRYAHLLAYDACGSRLAARLRVTGDEIALEVEDCEAIYPVTIDPTFIQQQKLVADDAAANDWFGWSVAISGDTAVVGAPAPLNDGSGANQGSAYVFVRSGTSWSQQQKLVASDAAERDEFGYSVAISGDTVIVGAVRKDSAYVFVRSGTSWSQQQKLVASDAAQGDDFGYSVAISGDTVVVSAPDEGDSTGGRGAAYVFVRSGTSWSQQQKLVASDGEVHDFFGQSVAISGDTAVVGSPLSGGPGGANQGAAYVFVRSGTNWSQQQKLVASDAEVNDHLGQSVAISGDTVIVGAWFDDAGAGFQQGSAYVFVRSGTSWSLPQKLVASDAAAGDVFGESVAISGDTVIVGAPSDDSGAGSEQGSAYVFVRSGTSWSERQKLTAASDAAQGDKFGSSVAISGATVVIGAPFDDVGAVPNQGSAYVFANTPPTIVAMDVSCAADAPASTSQIAKVGDTEDEEQNLVVTVTSANPSNGVTISGISVDAAGNVTASVGAACNATSASFTLRVTDSGGLFAEDTLNVTVTPDNIAPTLTLNPSIQLSPPDHTYRTVTIAQMVASVSDNCSTLTANDAVILQVTSDEPDNASGGVDGNTTNDIVIAGDCKSAQLRAERNPTKDGRVYRVTLRVRDAAGNAAQAVFMVTVPLNHSGAPAVDSGPANTVTSGCP